MVHNYLSSKKYRNKQLEKHLRINKTRSHCSRHSHEISSRGKTIKKNEQLKVTAHRWRHRGNILSKFKKRIPEREAGNGACEI